MPSLQQVVRGRVWKFGDSVDTTQLAGGGLQGSDAADTLRIPGDIVVAGANFGCGSSRQTAVEALLLCGVAAVLAESVARIHRRNSIALGLPTFVVPGISELVEDGDILEVDYQDRIVRNISRQRDAGLPAFPTSVELVYEVGGLFNVIAKRLVEQGIVVPT
jgi:3-isopropylmalate/(R)-2-methylmalate dehydratase small subunit